MSDAPIPRVIPARRGGQSTPIVHSLSTLRIRLVYPPLRAGEFHTRPLKKVKYVLRAGHVSPIRGETDDEGMLVARIPSDVTRAVLEIENLWTVPLKIRELDAEEDGGDLARLNNLGLYSKGDGASTYRALKRFEALVAPSQRDPNADRVNVSVGSEMVDSEIFRVLKDVHDR